MFKTEFGSEKYIEAISDCRYRIAMTKLRSSSHTLKLNAGDIQNLRPTYANDCVLYVTSSKTKYIFLQIANYTMPKERTSLAK